MTPASRIPLGARLLVAGFLAAWAGLILIPLALMLAYSLFRTEGFGTVHEVSGETWAMLFSSGRWVVGARTFGFALVVTAVAAAIAVPFAFWVSKRCRSGRLRAAVLVALTIPFFLEITSRTIVWRTILGTGGLVNQLLELVGIPAQPWLLFSPFAVGFGMVLLYFPAMFFPTFMAMELIDDSLIAAAEDAGAAPLQVMGLVVLPLALPGILAGMTFTFVPAMAEFAVPQILGGFNVNLLGNSINAALSALRYPMAAALSGFVLASLALFAGLLWLRLRRSQGLGAALGARGE